MDRDRGLTPPARLSELFGWLCWFLIFTAEIAGKGEAVVFAFFVDGAGHVGEVAEGFALAGEAGDADGLAG